MSSLQDIKDQIGQRRTYEMRESEIEGKLSSKRDWYKFFELNLCVGTQGLSVHRSASMRLPMRALAYGAPPAAQSLLPGFAAYGSGRDGHAGAAP